MGDLTKAQAWLTVNPEGTASNPRVLLGGVWYENLNDTVVIHPGDKVSIKWKGPPDVPELVVGRPRLGWLRRIAFSFRSCRDWFGVRH